MTFLYQFNAAEKDELMEADAELCIGIPGAYAILAGEGADTLTEAAIQNEALLDSLLTQGGEILIRLPETLSLDDCAAAYLAKQYLENGRMPKAADRLAQYVKDSLSQTLHANADSLYTLRFVIQLLAEYYADMSVQERNLLLLEKSEILFKRASINLLLDPYYDLATAPIAKDESQFLTEINSAAEDFEHYLADKDDETCCRVFSVPVPLESGGIAQKPRSVLMWKQAPSCEHPLFWARLDNFPLCLIYQSGETGASVLLEELTPSAEEPLSMTGLAQMLEYRELYREAVLAKEGLHSKRMRRDPAVQLAPMPELPFGITNDPWQTESQRLLSPTGGTCLGADEIAETLTAAGSCTAERNSLRVILPFVLEPSAVNRFRSLLKGSAFAAEELPENLTDYSADEPPLYFANRSVSSVSIGTRNLLLSGGADVCLYRGGVGLLSFETHTPGEKTAFRTVDDLQALQAEIISACTPAETTSAPLFWAAFSLPVLPDCVFEAPLFFTALQAGIGYLHLGKEQFDRDAYRLASGDNSAFSVDDFNLYRPDTRSCIAYDARGCALMCAGTETENTRFSAFTGQYYFLFAALIQRRIMLERINRTLFTLSPISVSALKKNRRLMLYMGNTVLTPSENATEANAFFTRGQEIYALPQASADIQDRLQTFQDYLQQQSVVRVLRLCCLGIPLLIAVTVLGSGLIKLPPLFDLTNGFSVSEKPTVWLLWLGVAAVLGGAYWLCYHFAVKRKK